MCTYDAYTMPIPHNDEFSISQASEESSHFMEVTNDHPGHVPSFCVRVCAICALECRNGVCARVLATVLVNTQHLTDFQSSLSCLEPRKVVCT